MRRRARLQDPLQTQPEQEDGIKAEHLFCYQSDWQQRLLDKYGQRICLLDATYRTCHDPSVIADVCNTVTLDDRYNERHGEKVGRPTKLSEKDKDTLVKYSMYMARKGFHPKESPDRNFPSDTVAGVLEVASLIDKSTKYTWDNFKALVQEADNDTREAAKMSMSVGSLTCWNLHKRVSNKDLLYLLHLVSVEETDAVMADLWQQHTEEMMFLNTTWRLLVAPLPLAKPDSYGQQSLEDGMQKNRRLVDSLKVPGGTATQELWCLILGKVGECLRDAASLFSQSSPEGCLLKLHLKEAMAGWASVRGPQDFSSETTRHNKCPTRLIGEHAVMLKDFGNRIVDSLKVPGSVSLSVWTLAKAIPYHARILWNNYRVGYVIISLQAKESKHSALKADLSLTNSSKSPYSYNPHFHCRVPKHAGQAGHCLCGREKCNEDDELCSTCEKACAVVECADDGKLSPTVPMLLKPHECSVCRERFVDGCALTAHSATHQSSSGIRIDPHCLTVVQMRKECKRHGLAVGGNRAEVYGLHKSCDSTGASCFGSAFPLDHTSGKAPKGKEDQKARCLQMYRSQEHVQTHLSEGLSMTDYLVFTQKGVDGVLGN
ncbi:hypothetical protein Bbelb_082650 [Branchiostoma belcheri]|nr:hypothetical protein Bbelb_082650 [Branchiostoma belcheri]